MNKNQIINNPEQWILTKQGDFIRIKDSECWVDPDLEYIREELKKPFGPNKVVRFKGETPEQVSQERYNKLYKDNEYNYDKIHAWLYDSQNQDKLEVVKLTGTDFKEAVQAIFKAIKQTKAKWRLRWKGVTDKEFLVNEESGQILWATEGVSFTELEQDKGILIDPPRVSEPQEEHKSTVIVLVSAYGKSDFPVEKDFPNTKFLFPNQPTIQSDFWHGVKGAAGKQAKTWYCNSGDSLELKNDLKDLAENKKIMHTDTAQRMRSVDYINELIEQQKSTSSKNIIIVGNLPGAKTASIIYLTSPHKLDGFVVNSFYLPWNELPVKWSDKNKETPLILISRLDGTENLFEKKSYETWKEKNNIEYKEVKNKDETNELVAEKMRSLLKNTQDNQHQEERESLWQQPVTYLLIGGIVIVVGVLLIYLLNKRQQDKK